jgi:hypothetical protein
MTLVGFGKDKSIYFVLLMQFHCVGFKELAISFLKNNVELQLSVFKASFSLVGYSLGQSISSRHSQSYCCSSPLSPLVMPFMILTTPSQSEEK